MEERKNNLQQEPTSSDQPTIRSIKKILLLTFLFLSYFEFRAQTKDLDPKSSFWKDSMWRADIEIKAAKLYNIRQQLIYYALADTVYSTLDRPMVEILNNLDSIYTEELFDKKETLQRSTFQFKKRMFCYSYLSTDLDLDLLLYFPKTYSIFRNPMSKLFPSINGQERYAYAQSALEDLFKTLKGKDKSDLRLMERLVNDLQVKKISTATQLLQGTPSEEDSYYHDMIDALLLTVRLNKKTR